MFDIGWSEMAVIALVTLVLFGPKELPAALRTGAKLMRQGRKLAREFHGSIDQLIKEAELEEVKNLATAAKRGQLDRELEKVIDPTGEMKQAVDPHAVRRELNADGSSLPKAAVPKPAVSPAPPVAPPAAAAPTVDAPASAPPANGAAAATDTPPTAPAEAAPAASKAAPEPETATSNSQSS